MSSNTPHTNTRSPRGGGLLPAKAAVPSSTSTSTSPSASVSPRTNNKNNKKIRNTTIISSSSDDDYSSGDYTHSSDQDDNNNNTTTTTVSHRVISGRVIKVTKKQPVIPTIPAAIPTTTTTTTTSSSQFFSPAPVIPLNRFKVPPPPPTSSTTTTTTSTTATARPLPQPTQKPKPPPPPSKFKLQPKPRIFPPPPPPRRSAATATSKSTSSQPPQNRVKTPIIIVEEVDAQPRPSSKKIVVIESNGNFVPPTTTTTATTTTTTAAPAPSTPVEVAKAIARATAMASTAPEFTPIVIQRPRTGLFQAPVPRAQLQLQPQPQPQPQPQQQQQLQPQPQPQPHHVADLPLILNPPRLPSHFHPTPQQITVGVFHAMLVGMRFVEPPRMASMGERLILKREPTNPINERAILVENIRGEKLGYVCDGAVEFLSGFLLSGFINIFACIAGPRISDRYEYQYLDIYLVTDNKHHLHKPPQEKKKAFIDIMKTNLARKFMYSRTGVWTDPDNVFFEPYVQDLVGFSQRDDRRYLMVLEMLDALPEWRDKVVNRPV